MGEAMDYMGLISGEASGRLFDLSGHRVVDGHAPGVTGRQLAAYMVAGPSTDHETSDPELILERRRLGMWTLIREGSAARDLTRALPYLVEHGTERTALCTDDRNAAALAEHHHLDGVVAALCRAGVPVAAALRAATINPATLYRLFDRGSVTPGFRADLLIVEDPACAASPRGHPDGPARGPRRRTHGASAAHPAAGFSALPAGGLPRTRPRPRRLRRRPPGPGHPHHAAGHRQRRALRGGGGRRRPPPGRPRQGRLPGGPHGAPPRHRSGSARTPVSGTSLATKIGCGLVSGLGLRSGAIATTIAHDAHHLLVVGVDPADMLAAARAVAAAGGGLAVVKGDMAQVLPLPLAGLMADLPVREVAAQLRSLERAAGSLGVDFEEPFMVLSFITLSVIPRLRLTLDGLLDVDAQALVPVVVD